MKSTVVKRSVVVADHKTSVSLEDEFWRSMKEIATLQNMTLSDLVSEIDKGRTHENLSCAIRLHVLDFYRKGAIKHGQPLTYTGDAITQR